MLGPKTLMLLTAKFANTKLCKNPEKPLKPLANGYSSESAQQELSNEYQHDRVLMVLKNLCIFVLWAKVTTALEGLTFLIQYLFPFNTSILYQVPVHIPRFSHE